MTERSELDKPEGDTPTRRLIRAMGSLLTHCDLAPEGETDFERAVIEARRALAVAMTADLASSVAARSDLIKRLQDHLPLDLWPLLDELSAAAFEPAVSAAEWSHLVEVARQEGFIAGRLSVSKLAPAATECEQHPGDQCVHDRPTVRAVERKLFTDAGAAELDAIEMQDSPTPMTDAFYAEYLPPNNVSGRGRDDSKDQDIEFARQLERGFADANTAAAFYVRDEPDITPRRAIERQAVEIERLKGELAEAWTSSESWQRSCLKAEAKLRHDLDRAIENHSADLTRSPAHSQIAPFEKIILDWEAHERRIDSGHAAMQMRELIRVITINESAPQGEQSASTRRADELASGRAVTGGRADSPTANDSSALASADSPPTTARPDWLAERVTDFVRRAINEQWRKHFNGELQHAQEAVYEATKKAVHEALASSIASASGCKKS